MSGPRAEINLVLVTHKSRQLLGSFYFRFLLSTSSHLHQQERAEKRSIAVDVVLRKPLLCARYVRFMLVGPLNESLPLGLRELLQDSIRAEDSLFGRSQDLGFQRKGVCHYWWVEVMKSYRCLCRIDARASDVCGISGKGIDLQVVRVSGSHSGDRDQQAEVLDDTWD